MARCHLFNLVLLFLYLNVFFVECQICPRRVEKIITVQKSYFHTYRATYRKEHCWFRCTATRIKTYATYKTVPETTVEYIRECCPGYDTIYTEGQPFNCKPKCLPACKNGYCESPGVCACNEGYSPDPSNPHTCLPICEPSCLHGTCIEPNTCKCDFGYELQDRQCQPVCSDPCENGVCEAPETCTCLSGFRMSENKMCVPYCSKGCDNGICTNPETCSCEFGWNLKTPNSCEPMCSRPCGNGTCTRPDECDCNRGYKLDLNNTLETDMCIPNCGNCEGVCVAPGECVCDPPYTAKAVRDDGEECDCVSDCSIANKTCDRTICYIETTSPSTETDATSTEQEFTDADYTSSTNDDLDYNTTENISVIVTTPTTNTNFLLSNAANRSKEIGSWKLFGVIVGAVVLLCCMSIIIIVIIYRKHICRYMNGTVYVVDDNVGTDEVGDQFDFSRIEFSSILRNRQEEEESHYAEIRCKGVSNYKN